MIVWKRVSRERQVIHIKSNNVLPVAHILADKCLLFLNNMLEHQKKKYFYQLSLSVFLGTVQAPGVSVISCFYNMNLMLHLNIIIVLVLMIIICCKSYDIDYMKTICMMMIVTLSSQQQKKVEKCA